MAFPLKLQHKNTVKLNFDEGKVFHICMTISDYIMVAVCKCRKILM